MICLYNGLVSDGWTNFFSSKEDSLATLIENKVLNIILSVKSFALDVSNEA